MRSPVSTRGRTKAWYLTFEYDQGAEYEFYLAEKLGMLVSELRARIGTDELLGWSIYHARKAQRQEMQDLKARGASA